jgi:hypothetical protein
MPGREAGLVRNARAHYLGAMPLPRPASPRALANDLRNFWRARPRGHWIAALLAAAMTAGIVIAFLVDSRSMGETREQVIFLDSWPVDRTDAQIRAKQQADLDERTRAEAEHRRQLRRLDENLNRLGI